MTTAAKFDEDYLTLLRKSWGNPQFSVCVPFLIRLVELVEQTSGPILECGSGLTTLILAKVTERPIVVLEHDKEWLDKLRAFWDNKVPANVDLRHTPIKKYLPEQQGEREYYWYDVGVGLPENIDLVICDGPPTGIKGIANVVPMRMGLLPVVRTWLKPGVKILMDDYLKPEQDKTVQHWQKKWDMNMEVYRHKSDPTTWHVADWAQPYGVLTILAP